MNYETMFECSHYTSQIEDARARCIMRGSQPNCLLFPEAIAIKNKLGWVDYGVTYHGLLIKRWNGETFEAVEISKINEEPMELDVTKPMQTRDGRKVKMLTTIAKGRYPLVGLVEDGNHEQAIQWTADGNPALNGARWELMNVPEVTG